jgi:hypothetical protein
MGNLKEDETDGFTFKFMDYLLNPCYKQGSQGKKSGI